VLRPSQAEPCRVEAAGAVVLDARECILLIRRGRPPAAGEWTLPGGRVEAGESPEATVIRELREETAIDGRILASLGVVEIVRDGVSFAIHEYLVAPVSEDAPRAGDDACDVRWVPRGELEALRVRSDAIAVIECGLARRRSLA
jgi:ADP-ribose pyrophosphatase YjhB (NUDIX family)